MPTYKAPVSDTVFLLSDVFDYARYANSPGFSEAPIDVVEAVTGDDDDRHLGAQPDLAQQIEAVLQTQPKIEDYQVHLGAAEMIDHLLAIGGHQSTDVVLHEIV